MNLLNSMEQNIYVNGAIANSEDFKNTFVDRMLDIRDKVELESGYTPVIGMSRNTFIWFKRLFCKDFSYVEIGDITTFWRMEIRVMDMRDGLIDFYIDVA